MIIMIFGICHLWNFGTFAITILGGVFVAVAVLLVQELHSNQKMKNDFKWIKGEWDGSWVLKDRNVESSTVSNATICYIKNNILWITLIHDKEVKQRTWEGILEMNKQIKNRGSLVFIYNDSHESGYKEILLSSDKEYDYIYLFPVIYDERNTINYGIQVLKRKSQKIYQTPQVDCNEIKIIEGI